MRFKNMCMVVLALIMLVTIGCSKNVPQGWIAMVQEPEGLTGEILQSGYHSAYNRDKLVLVDTKDAEMTEKMKVLCADELNFSFDLKIRGNTTVNGSNEFKDLMTKQGSKITWDGEGVGKLMYGTIYNTYIKGPARSVARGIVSRYETTQIRDKRAEIEGAIKIALMKLSQGSPVNISWVGTSNFDYPKVISDSMEKKKQREVEIQEEKAKQALELLKVDNRIKMAVKEKAARAAEAEKEATFNKIVSKSLTDNYLKLREIERDIILYSAVGPGDKVIITNGNAVMPIIGNK
jgi:hypothetical protein